jgi:hypothetical protein
MQESEGVWLSILEYAQFKKISVSTIRRYIKSKRVETKQIKGKFFIRVSRDKYEVNNSTIQLDNRESLKFQLEVQELKIRLKTLEEENNDLKMLVQLYEQAQRKQQETILPNLPKQ